MKRLLKRILLVFLLLATLIACDSKKENNKNIKLCESWDFENGFFTILSPNLTSNYSIYNYLPNFYETLVKYENGKYQRMEKNIFSQLEKELNSVMVKYLTQKQLKNL